MPLYPVIPVNTMKFLKIRFDTMLSIITLRFPVSQGEVKVEITVSIRQIKWYNAGKAETKATISQGVDRMIVEW